MFVLIFTIPLNFTGVGVDKYHTIYIIDVNCVVLLNIICLPLLNIISTSTNKVTKPYYSYVVILL